MAFQQVIEKFLDDNSELKELEVLVVDVCGHFFGKRYPVDKLGSFAEEGLAFPASMFLLGATGDALTDMYYGIDDGDPDADFHLIENSLCINQWGSQPRAQVMASTIGSGKPAFFEPRAVLQNILQSYAERGWKPMVAFELEFYLLDGERDNDDLIQVVNNPKTGRKDSATVLSCTRISDFESVIDDIIESCRDQNISTGAISSEMGPGQFEINFNHHADVLRAADETCLFKRTVVEIAKKHGMTASFMAKPFLAEAGNGLHMHISVIDENGDNIFADGDKPTDYLKNAIAGLIDCMPACMSFWAPNVNAYRRYKGGTSCAPVSQSWGHENRTVAFRIPIARDSAWRVENRVPGADANPYLAMATSLAAMLHGINNKMDPGDASTEAINTISEGLPLDLSSALAVTRNNKAFSDILGSDFVDLYLRHRDAEFQSFGQLINAREYDWYL
jgi:glutamine synthetase